MTVEPVTRPTLYKDGSIKWTMRAERKIVQNIDPARVTQMIQGFSSWYVTSKLEENLPLATAPEVRLSPAWWPWMPIVPFRITVVTQ